MAHCDEPPRGPARTTSIKHLRRRLNRSIAGAYQVVSPRHLDAYLDELEWRFNNRNDPHLWRERMR